MNTSIVTQLTELTVRRAERVILEVPQLTIHSGEHWVVLGANGAGKSTLLSICGAQEHPTAGQAYVLGEKLGRTDLQALRTRIGHVNPRHELVDNLTVSQVILTGITGTTALPFYWQPTSDDVAKCEQILNELGLRVVAHQHWHTLSQGERTRTLIARALISTPALLIMDEPATGLDVAAREELLHTMQKLPLSYPTLTMITVTHHVEEIPDNATHVLVLRSGTVLAAGELKSTLNSEIFSAAFNYPLVLAQDRGRWSARAAL